MLIDDGGEQMCAHFGPFEVGLFFKDVPQGVGIGGDDFALGLGAVKHDRDVVGLGRGSPHGEKVVARAGAEGFGIVFEGDTVGIDKKPAVTFQQKCADKIATHGDGVLIGVLQANLPDARV